ncbi:MAG: PilT/PilU family type 4a pilus ATPase [Pseudomonadota bacterium]|nr:PilT/PilU family type 4a pilus ATPase [Pseudomonadota bacterium]QKK06613.1 MAG: PilT/PilU family type 4a pilus ATPase [Pseudomonadota bacterium]
MVENKASDLYITVGLPPTMRIENELKALDSNPLAPDTVQDMLSKVLTSRQRREYESTMELNLALDMGDSGRFRVNVLRQKQFPAMVIRRITSQIPSFEELHLPDIFRTLALKKRGLILISGVTSSGKSTSLASMVDYRNQNMGGHIITIEDPIEYAHDHKKSIITQREVGIDTQSYQVALKNALRQKPDAILVGEIRDAEVMEMALNAAETGHLCLSTIHTNNAIQAIERMISLFPEERHNQVRIALSMNLSAIVGQRLVNNKYGGLTPALEILLNEALIKDHILKGETSKIREVMANNTTSGMMLFDDCLFKLFREDFIDENTAIAECDIPSDMKMRIQQYRMSGVVNEGGEKSGAFDQVDTSKLSL